ncbi:MAG TPA: cytochrome c biogenesis protein CcsA [Longimicrobium sp.]|nr:cytochrome c biogenesis protein CcsA [Longimicrobium sp.]
MTQYESQASTRRWAIGLTALSGAMVLATFWMIFFYVPTEAEMGIVQRIYYVHVPSALVAYLAFGIVALCSLGYLWLRDERLDTVAVCAAELGLVFATIVLMTGPLWGKIAWGAWWVWDARTSLTLLLWFIYAGYFVLRGATESPERGKRFAAILGVVGAADIPLIHMSVQWFRTQHPKPVVLKPEGPTAAPEMVQTLLVSFLGFTLLFFSLLLARMVVEKLSRRLDAARVAATLRPGPTVPHGVSV